MMNIQLNKQISLLPVNLKEQVFSFVFLLNKNAAIKKNVKERTFGYAKGFFKMADDFDQPLEDFKDYV